MKPYLTFLTTIIMVCSVQAQGFKKAKTQTEKLFNNSLKNKTIHNGFLAVYSPSKNINWTLTGGKFRNGINVTEANPFHIASIGKTFTAIAIATLHEQGHLNFTDKINTHLPEGILHNLHTYKNKSYSHAITIAELLQHTSGIPDYYEGKTTDNSPNAMTLMLSDTGKFWTPIDMINLAKYKMKPNSPPGTSYHYSDTEFILLGLIIEKISGMDLHSYFQKHIFKPLKMQHTYMHLRSKAISKTKKMAELYVGDLDISKFTSLSLDWAGGGIVSTVSDLNTFQLALHTHHIIKKETLEQMQNWIPESKGTYYGYGLRKVDLKALFPTLPALQIIGHTGSTSSFMFYCPELDVYLSGTFNQINVVKKSIIIPAKVLAVVKKALKQ